MRNFVAKFVRILGICKNSAVNRVNGLEKCQEKFPGCGVVPKFLLQPKLLAITVKIIIFHRFWNECKSVPLIFGFLAYIKENAVWNVREK